MGLQIKVNIMSLITIDYDAAGNPIQPAVDPLTQTLEIVEIDGVKYWKITSYPIEERNDGSAPYVAFFTARRDSIMGGIDRLKQITQLWELLSESERQSLGQYRDQVSALTDFSPGFTFPKWTGTITSVPKSVIDRYVSL